MDRVKRREIASQGGKAAHRRGTAHKWTSEEAREAGHRGGMASHRRRTEMGDEHPAATRVLLRSQDRTEPSGSDERELFR